MCDVLFLVCKIWAQYNAHILILFFHYITPYSWLCFYSFTIITAFVVLNLIVAVVCEAVIEMRIEEKKEKIEEKSHNNKTGDKENAPIDDMIWQQEELLLVQGKLEKTLDKIMKRI